MNIAKKINLFTSSLKKYSEEDLVKKAKHGCDDSFEQLITIYENYLYRMAYLYVKNEQDALDIYQETILKAYMG